MPCHFQIGNNVFYKGLNKKICDTIWNKVENLQYFETKIVSVEIV